jgi:hypothetical protein
MHGITSRSCIRMCTHALTHARTHARTHACLHASTQARTHACTHARTHARTHACTHTRMYFICRWVCANYYDNGLDTGENDLFHGSSCNFNMHYLNELDGFRFSSIYIYAPTNMHLYVTRCSPVNRNLLHIQLFIKLITVYIQHPKYSEDTSCADITVEQRDLLSWRGGIGYALHCPVFSGLWRGQSPSISSHTNWPVSTTTFTTLTRTWWRRRANTSHVCMSVCRATSEYMDGRLLIKIMFLSIILNSTILLTQLIVSIFWIYSCIFNLSNLYHVKDGG